MPRFRVDRVVDSIETNRRAKFHTDPDEFKMHAKVSWGACELHLGCLVLGFISCLCFVQMGFVVSAGIHRCGKFHTGPNGFEIRAKMR